MLVELLVVVKNKVNTFDLRDYVEKIHWGEVV